jgi:flagellar protein FliT
MNSEQILSLYEAIAVITDNMLAAARNGDWEQFTDLESRCAGHVALLKQDQPPSLPAGELLDRKIGIIRKILADDREIRSITEPWMERLSAIINSAGTERKLSQAYGATRLK